MLSHSTLPFYSKQNVSTNSAPSVPTLCSAPEAKITFLKYIFISDKTHVIKITLYQTCAVLASVYPDILISVDLSVKRTGPLTVTAF